MLESFAAFWSEGLYKPVLNVLVWLYTHVSGDNLGVAVVLLTVGLRTILLPFSIIAERNRRFYAKLQERIAAIEHDFKNDSVVRREQIRTLLKEHHVSPWAKTVSLGIQALVLVLLYKVFVGGVQGKVTPDDLYIWNELPPYFNTLFAGFDIAVPNRWWAFAVGVVLFAEIWAEQRTHRQVLTRKDVLYSLFFPLISFGVLALLPMVKSLFILTSIAFSFMLMGIQHAFVGSGKEAD